MSSRPPYSDEQLTRAIEQLSDLGRLREAEGLVERLAPQLRALLNAALRSGGWFDSAQEAEIKRVAEIEGQEECLIAVRSLVEEQTQLGMLVGVAVGFELSRLLGTLE